MMSGMKKQRQITQHKRFAIAHPNFYFAETSLCWKRYTTWGAPQFPPEEKEHPFLTIFEISIRRRSCQNLV